MVRLEAETHAYWNDGTNHVLVLAESAFESERSSSDAAASTGTILDPEWRVYNSGLVHLRYGRDATEWLRPEVFTGVSYDEFLYLERRWIAGGGPRFTLAEGESGRAHFGASWMWEREASNPQVVLEPPTRTVQRLSTYLSGSAPVSGEVTVRAALYFQPAFRDLSDHRVLSDVLLSVDVAERWETGVEFETRYDSDPPDVAPEHPTLTRWNGAVSVVLVYQL